MANAWDSDPVANAAPAEKPAWAADPVVVRGGRRGGDTGSVRPLSADEERMIPGGEIRGAADTAYAGIGHAIAGAAKMVADTPQSLWDLYAHSPIGPNPGGAPHPTPGGAWIDAHTPQPRTAIGQENFDTAADLAKKGAENIGPMLRTTPMGAVADEAMRAPELAPLRRVGSNLSVVAPLASRAAGMVGGAVDEVAASRAGASKYGLAGDENSPASVAHAAGYDIPAAQNPNATLGTHIGDTVAGQANRRLDATHRNQVTTNVHAHIEAGLPDNVRMTQESLAAAEEPHNQTLNRAADIAQTAPASTEFTTSLKKAGGTDILAEDDPRIQKIIDKINAHGDLSGQDLLDVSRSTKARGRKYQKSPLPDQQELGDSLVRIAKATDDELARRLPPGSPVQAEDVANARASLAKIHTVQDAMVGDNVDANYLARLDARDPGLLTGRLKIIAQTAANHPQVMGLAQRATMGGEGVSAHHGAALLTAATGAVVHNPALAAVAVGSVGARAALRRIMSGGRTAGVSAAEGAATNPALSQFFDKPVTPRAPNVLELEHPPGNAFEPNAPAPGPALDLRSVQPGEPFPAPTGHTNPTRALALSPDRSSLPFDRQFGPGEHGLGPDTGGLSLAHDAPRSPASHTGEISLADLLSHGVEQPAHPGLSLAPDYVPPNGLHIPGNTLADLLSGDLNTAEHGPVGPRPNHSDVPAVLQEHPAPEFAVEHPAPPPSAESLAVPHEAPPKGRGGNTLADMLAGDLSTVDHNPAPRAAPAVSSEPYPPHEHAPGPPLPPPSAESLAVPHGELPPTEAAPRKAAPRPLGDMMDEERAHHPPLELASDEAPRGLGPGNVTEIGTTASGAKIRKVGAGVELPGRDGAVRPIEPGSTLISKGPDAKPTSYIAITPQEDGRMRLTSAHSDVKGEGQQQITEAAHHVESLDKPLDSDVSVSKAQLYAWRAAISKGKVTATTKFQKQIDKILASKGEKGTLKMTTPIYTDIKPVIEN